MRQFEPPHPSAPRPVTFRASLVAHEACGAGRLVPPPLHYRPTTTRLGTTVSECCAAQKYNDKAEKDKARYAAEMKKCGLLLVPVPCSCAHHRRTRTIFTMLSSRCLRLAHVVLLSLKQQYATLSALG